MQEQISNLYDALVGALTLAITAPTEEKAQKAVRLAECFAAGLSRHEVERAKKEAEGNVK
tara:strand:+ start:300 stop:479 length:180 start_codon:yes stop_codon:yes gene_type:complete